MEKKDSFVFYESFFEAIKDLKDKDKIKIYDAICELALNGNEIELTGISKTIFTLIKPQILANSRKRENGSKGGRPKKENLNKTTGFENEKPQVLKSDEKTKTKTKPNVNVNVNVNGNVNANGNVNGVGFEKDETEDEIVKTYEEEIGLLSPAAAEQLFNYLDTFSEDVIVLAIKKASLSNKRSFNYVKGILNSWDRKNLRTVLDIEREEEEFEARKEKKEEKEETPQEWAARMEKEWAESEY